MLKLLQIGLLRGLLYVMFLCLYGLVCLFLLAISLGFGLRAGRALYADEGFGVRASAGILLILLVIAGVYLLTKRLSH
jgi:hypothetical protein